MLFFSFFLSIVSAVLCALIQQWCYEYLKFAYPWAAPHKCGRVRTFLFQGLQLRTFIYGTHALLHISVFLFFWAISDFFHTVHHHFGLATRYTLIVSAAVYILLSISPLIFSNSPCNTPMTPLLRAGYIILRITIRSPLLCLRWYRSEPLDLTGLQYYKGLYIDRAHLYLIKAEEWAEKLEPYAMKWLFSENVFSDKDMDKFLEGLPGYMSSSHTKKGQLDQYLTDDLILSRIKEHLMTCVTSVELSDDESIARVSSCVRALLRIFSYSRESKGNSPNKLEEELRKQRTHIQGLIDDFQNLCGMDPVIALRASCIRALAVQGLLSHIVSPDGITTENSPFPVSLIPIYTFLFSNDDMDTIRQLNGLTPTSTPSDENGRLWNSLLHDGPLVNLTILARVVCDKDQSNHIPSSTFSFCWNTFDLLLAQLGTIHSEESTSAQTDFDDLHKSIGNYVHEERGFRVRPLLDKLDTVSRGRRLFMLFKFSERPEYHNEDVIFGKEYLHNPHLLEAFAHCLPHFISKTSPVESKKFMEKVVCHDDLWASLRVNLWNAEKSESPTPDKLRVFEDCCTVIELAFTVLEDSEEVDWRAPGLGSLSRHFESFITHSFQGAFMEKVTRFRVEIIEARLCRALLAQFGNESRRNGIITFRSQWDVASLARLICALDLRDKDDPEFWNYYVNGGHIGEEFEAKAVEMVKITARDGPILIFCLLGQLAATSVPLDQSGLETKDIVKVWELQTKLIDQKHLPSDPPSDIVWQKVEQLRKQLNDLHGENIGKDREVKILQQLLQTIDRVCNLRPSDSGGPSQSKPAGDRGPRTPAPVNSASPSGLSRNIKVQFSFSSEPPAVGGPLSGMHTTDTSESEGGFGIIPRISINLQPEAPERLMESFLDGEMKTYRRSESPQRHESASHQSLHPPVETVNRFVPTSRPSIVPPVTAMPYFPYIGDSHQRLTSTSTRRSSRLSASNSEQFRPRGRAAAAAAANASTFLPNTVITSSPNTTIDDRPNLLRPRLRPQRRKVDQTRN